MHAAEALAELEDARTPRERSTWHEDDGPVLWWLLPVCEPPYCGTPLDDDFPEYVTHWTPLLVPSSEERKEHPSGQPATDRDAGPSPHDGELGPYRLRSLTRECKVDRVKPKRIQLRRAKGWRKPEGAVVVSRPSKWGNPYALRDYQVSLADGSPAPWDEAVARTKAVRDFEHALLAGLLPFTVDDVRRELRGKDLCCWCPIGKACHADVLLEIANAEAAR